MEETRRGPDTPDQVVSGDGRSAGSDAFAYWRANLTLLGVLLAVWFVVGYVFGILLVEPLNKVSVGTAPLGFWIAQQGSIYVFVLLIAVYVVLMGRIDRRFGVREA